jgi:hypothetical protein
VDDSWSYLWGASFTSKRAYNSIVGSSPAPRQFVWLWKSCCRGRHKIFFWLLLLNRLNTRNLLRRKNFYLQSYDCVLCSSNVEENLEHLFFDCTFSVWCWRLVDITWDISLPIMERLQSAQVGFGAPVFMEIVILVAWCIWTTHNRVIFDGAVPSLGQWKHSLRVDLFLSLLKCKSTKKSLLQDWLAQF